MWKNTCGRGLLTFTFPLSFCGPMKRTLSFQVVGPKHQKHAPSQAALLQAAGGQRQGIAGVSPLAGSKAPTFGVRYGPSTSAVLDKQVKILWGLEVMAGMSELDEQTPVIQDTPFSSRLPAGTTLRHPQGLAKCTFNPLLALSNTPDYRHLFACLAPPKSTT